MRRVNIVTGIKQRINEILGQGTDGDLTAWSIQSAMLSNFERIAKALNSGSSIGKILSGLTVTNSGLVVTVASGYAVTLNGGIISLESSLEKDLSGDLTDDADNYLCLRYSLSSVDNTLSYGKFTPLIGAANEQIVFDELGFASSPVNSNILEVKSSISQIQADHDLVHIATITMASGSITGITRSGASRGQVIVVGGSELTITSGNDFHLSFGTVLQDTAEEWSDGTPNYYTARTNGFRQISWKISLQDSSNWAVQEFCKTYICINDNIDSNYCFKGSYRGFANNAEGVIERESIGSALVYLSAGDYVKLNIYQNSGNNQTIPASNNNDRYLTISTITDY